MNQYLQRSPAKHAALSLDTGCKWAQVGSSEQSRHSSKAARNKDDSMASETSEHYLLKERRKVVGRGARDARAYMAKWSLCPLTSLTSLAAHDARARVATTMPNGSV